MVQVKTTYTTVDGKEFADEADALAHEQKREARNKKRHEEFLKSDRYKSLLRKHNLSDIGVWAVRGEEAFRPIGHVEGTLEKAILWAVAQDNWSSWGHGGDLEKLNVISV